ncbi:glycosyltransferase family 39 protein [Candidatus Sumerlaeota bacterium]|nr:glycosyltransferase family 39 protein [Candidatus Sumerlaeota bacterium]MBI3735725.1 glycosyltransferase family 39 protein [Candidatus Sumerlaeota bacterium]
MNSEIESAAPEKPAPPEPDGDTQRHSPAPESALPTPERRGVPFFYHVPLLIPFLILMYLLIPIKARFDAALKFPFQMDAEEGFIYQEAQDLYLGNPIYHPVNEEPYLVGNYPPLFQWAISRLIGPRMNGLALGRLVVFFSAMLIVQFLALTVYYRARLLLPALLAPLLFAVSYEFHQWSAFCRVDIPALALTMMGIFFFSTGSRRRSLVVSAVFFVLAGYTRQTAVIAPLACCITLFFRDRKGLIWFLAPYLLLGSGTFLMLNLVTRGEFFRHTVLYNRNAMDWVSWRAVMRNEVWFFYRWWILALVFGVVFRLLAWAGKLLQSGANESDAGTDAGVADSTAVSGRNHALPARGMAGIYFLLAAVSLLSFAKVGSAPNYGLEPLMAAALFGMETLGRLSGIAGDPQPFRRNSARLGLLAMGLFLIMHSLYVGGGLMFHRPLWRSVSREMFSSRNPDLGDIEAGRAVLAAVQSSAGDILTEFPIFSILSGREVLYEPFIMSRLAEEGLWEEKNFDRMLDERRFSLVITAQDLRGEEKGEHLWRFTPHMARAILARYALHAIIAPPQGGGLGQTYYLWTPLNSAQKEKDARMNRLISGIGFSPDSKLFGLWHAKIS